MCDHPQAGNPGLTLGCFGELLMDQAFSYFRALEGSYCHSQNVAEDKIGMLKSE